MSITVLGDVHQRYDDMDELNLHNDYVVQVGDLGFNYEHIYKNYNYNKFKICLGNHDMYDNRPKEYDLGDYGLSSLNDMEFFFVRGEWSIDIKQRQKYESTRGIKVWWKEEELDRHQIGDCLSLYKKTKPDVVISHTCPHEAGKKIGNPAVWKFFGWDEPVISNTQLLLQSMFDAHNPKLWIHGHFHIDRMYKIGNTNFISLGELSYVNFDDKWRKTYACS